MKCSDINNLIYLKEEELSPDEFTALMKHLEECPSCAKEFSENAQSALLIDRIKRSSPLLADEVLFTDSVMEQIDNKVLSPEISFPGSILDRVSQFFLIPLVRAAAVSVILILVSTFIVQQYLVFHNVSDLENKLAINNGTQFTAAQIGFNGLKGVKLASDLYNLVNGSSFYADLSRGMILADKSKINELLTLYSRMQSYKRLYSKEIEEKYPELNTFLGKELSIEGLQEFVKKNENLIRELSRKIPAGGK
jgi:hypothetical protein